jgi:hypothetical protein
MASKELIGFGPRLVVVPKIERTSPNSQQELFSSDSGSFKKVRVGDVGDCSTGNGGETVLIPIDDAYVSPRRKWLNRGNETMMVVDGRQGNVALMKFDVSCLTNSITSAVLKVYVVDGSRNGGLFHVLTHDDESTWHEDMVTWSNAPRSYNKVAQLEKVVNGTWNEVDITHELVGE